MMATPKRSALFSGLLHAAAIAFVLLITSIKTPTLDPPPVYTPGHEVRNYISIVARPSDGGGGGGTRDPLPAMKGEILRVSHRPFVPPAARIVNDNPRLAMEPAVFGSQDFVPVLPANAHWGLPDGIGTVPSNGPGRNGGIGDTGDGGGDGNKKGPGAGDKDGPGISGRARLTGFITQPELIAKVEPEYTEEARKAKLQGTVVLSVEVNERGQPQNISVRQSLGLGLDERAVEAVQRWRFRAGTQNGKPVVTVALIQVSFRLL